MMSLWDALRMNMMISYQELVRTFLNIGTVLASALNCHTLPAPNKNNTHTLLFIEYFLMRTLNYNFNSLFIFIITMLSPGIRES
ncbi:hypothetical protein DVQ29_11590 [Yersinia enterocolitica]|nr:hypothetical protein [Yersinia enterocolitica]